MTFGERLRNARKNKGLTQKQLADLIGAKHNSISDWENNKNRPDPDTIEYICGALEIPVSHLFSDTVQSKNFLESTDIDGQDLMAAINRIMSGENKLAKSVLIAFTSLTEEEWQVIRKLIERIHNNYERIRNQ